MGLRQAALVAERLAHPHDAPALPLPEGPLRELVHSPLRRTAQTAEALAAAMIPSPVARPDAGFLEIGQGEWEGLHRDEIGARYGETLAGWRRTPTEAWAPGGESLAQVAARVRPALTGVLDRARRGRHARARPIATMSRATATRPRPRSHGRSSWATTGSSRSAC